MEYIDISFCREFATVNLGDSFEPIDQYENDGLTVVVFQDTKNPIFGDTYKVPFDPETYDVVFPE